MPRSLRRFLLSVALSTVAFVVYVFFGLYLVLGLILLNIVCWCLRRSRESADGAAKAASPGF
jgi:hypothetical protein